MEGKLKRIVLETCRRKAVIIAAAMIVLYTLTGFFLLPYLIERFLPESLGKRLDIEVSLQQVKINPYKLTLEAGEFQINEPSGRAMAGFRRLYINFQLSSLFRWALTFKDIILDAPAINIVIDPDGELNLAGLAGNNDAPPPAPPEEASRPLRMLLRNININGGKIDVTDRRQPIPATVSFSPLDIQLSDIATLPEHEGPYTLTTRATDGATLQLSGRISLQPLHSEGILEFKEISLITPWKFARSQLNIAPPKGHLDLKTRYLIDVGKETTTLVSNDLGVRIMDAILQIEGAEESLLNLKEINLDIGNMDVIRRRIDDLRLAIQGGDLDLIRDRDGIFNIQRLTSGENNPVSSPSPPPGEGGTPWTINIPEINLGGLSLNYTDHGMAPALKFSIDDLLLVFKAAITTDSTKPLARVDDLVLTLQQIAFGFADTRPAFQTDNLTLAGAFDLGARSASISRLDLTDGMVNVIRNKDNTINLARLFESKNPTPDPSDKGHKAEKGEPWQFIAERISLSGFKSRFTDLAIDSDNPLIDLDKISLAVSRIDGKSPSPFEMGLQVVQGGELTASGSFDPSGAQVESTITIKDLSLPAMQPYISPIADLTLNSGLFSTRGKFNRAAKGGMSYHGQFGIAGLEIIENSTSDTLLGWRQLQTGDLRLDLNPNGIEIDTIKLTGLNGKLLISEDKTVNVVEAFKSKSRPSTEPRDDESAPESPGSPFPVRIGKLSLDKGRLEFADLSLSPQFATRIYELKGVIIGITSSPGARTQVELDGRVDQYGSSRIKGEINAYDPEQFTDISMVFRNLEMTNLTPYSGKFAGRKIDSGKLSLDLQYKIEDSRLLGDNKIFIESLKLGEKVENPDALSLPLDLAIALLKDSRGVIDIGLPVSGNLDDPEFKYGALIWKALVNLLTKIVTSPFRALGALLGGAEETLNTVNFEPGSGTVPPAEQEKLDKLLKALTQRPQLKLVVTGRYHMDSDGQAIRVLQVRRALAEKSGTAPAPGEDPGPVDFSNPDSLKRLAALFVEQYGQEAYEKLSAEITPPDNSGKTDKAPEDPGKLAKLLFSDLVKREPVDPNILKRLADDRANAIVRQITGPQGIHPERTTIKPSEESDIGNPVSSVLGLDAMAPNAKDKNIES